MAARPRNECGFIRRSVSRFMPGERIEDALRAARELSGYWITTILTHLGENLTTAQEADEVTAHYLQVLDKVAAAGLDAQISIKPTSSAWISIQRCASGTWSGSSRARSSSGGFCGLTWRARPMSTQPSRVRPAQRRRRESGSRFRLISIALLKTSKP